MNNEELIKKMMIEDSEYLSQNWEKLVAQLKEKTELPSENVMEMFKKCFEAGFSSGAVCAAKRMQDTILSSATCKACQNKDASIHTCTLYR